MRAPKNPAIVVRRIAAVLVALAAALLVPTAPLLSQGKESGGWLSAAFERVTGNADLTKRIDGYGYADGVCVLAAWVDANDSASFIRPLKAGTSYMFLAAGDKDARVVNLEILDGDGKNVLKSDGKKQPDAVLEFTPPENTYYTMRLTLAQSRENIYCICVAAILKKDGVRVPLANLNTCAKKITDVLITVDAEVKAKTGKRLDFYKAKNQWALYGGILKQGEELEIDNLTLGQGRKGFIAVGDNNTQDVDLFLLDRNGQIVAKDDSVNVDASFVYEPGPQKHSMKVLNYKAGGPSLIFMSTFDLINNAR